MSLANRLTNAMIEYMADGIDGLMTGMCLGHCRCDRVFKRRWMEVT